MSKLTDFISTQVKLRQDAKAEVLASGIDSKLDQTQVTSNQSSREGYALDDVLAKPLTDSTKIKFN